MVAKTINGNQEGIGISTDASPKIILLLEDNPGDARLIQYALQDASRNHRWLAQYQLVHISRLSDAMEQLTLPGLEIVLMDLNLPDSQGLETLIRLRENAQDLPVVVLSGLEDETIALEALRLGAQDYIVKADLDGRRIARTLHYAVERKEMLAQVQYQARLLETISEAVISTDTKFKVTSWNHAAETIYGWRAEEAIGQIMAELIPTLYLDQDRATVLTDFRKSGHWSGTVRQTRKNGQTIHILASVTRLDDESGHMIGSVAVNRDISERVMAEEALLAANQRLEAALEELQVTQEQMIRQERLAAVGQLSAGIAHEYNNMMTSILLYADLMLRISQLSPPDRQRLTSIRNEGQKAADLTQQILDFSRRSMLNRQPMELVASLYSLRPSLEQVLPTNIRLHVETESPPLMAQLDVDRWQQMIVNLTLNARDAMLNSGGLLHIALHTETFQEEDALPLTDMQVGSWICLTVRDTGIGIAPDVLPHIYEPFFTTRAPLGSGLGLSQVHGIVRQHGGFIDVASTPGQGTAFTIYLPQVDPA